MVLGIARHPEKLGFRHPGLAMRAGDVFNTDQMTALIKGQEAVISAYNPGWTNPNIYKEYIEGAKCIQEEVKQADIRRLIVVGGAGSLEIAPGTLLIESPDFPAIYLEEASSGKAFLDALRHVADLDWTFLSPSALFVDGERTGKFRLGKDSLLVDADGKSWISFEDYAVAMLDEIEHPAHVRQRFVVGY